MRNNLRDANSHFASLADMDVFAGASRQRARTVADDRFFAVLDQLLGNAPGCSVFSSQFAWEAQTLPVSYFAPGRKQTSAKKSMAADYGSCPGFRLLHVEQWGLQENSTTNSSESQEFWRFRSQAVMCFEQLLFDKSTAKCAFIVLLFQMVEIIGKTIQNNFVKQVESPNFYIIKECFWIAGKIFSTP